MTEYGLSVSLDVSPRESPRSPLGVPRSSSFTPTTTNDYHCVGAPRKIMKFADICCENDHSISPRILCPPSETLMATLFIAISTDGNQKNNNLILF